MKCGEMMSVHRYQNDGLHGPFFLMLSPMITRRLSFVYTCCLVAPLRYVAYVFFYLLIFVWNHL